MIMLLVTILSLIIITCYEILKLDISLSEAIPFNFSAIVVIASVLAYFNILSLTNVILPASALIVLVLAISDKQFSELVNIFRNILRSYRFYTICLTILIISILMWNRGIVAYDDFKYWAASVKALAANNGYEAAYSNVGPAYGDYPQGLLLFLWWAENISGGWHENVLYIAQTVLTVSFLFPLLDSTPENPLSFLMSLLLIALSSAFTRFGMSLEPDRTMAVIYSAAMLCIFDMDRGNIRFNILRLSLYLTVIVLMKSVGILWAVSALIFLIVLRKTKAVNILATAVLPVLSCIVWFSFCRMNFRTTYLTQNMLYSLKVPLDEAVRTMAANSFIIKMFLRNFALNSINCSSFMGYRGILSLSAMAYFLLYAVLFLAAGKYDCNESREVRRTGRFFIVSGLLYFLILLWSYLFMFAPEFSADNPGHMQNMTSHYSEPALMAPIVVLFRIFTRNKPYTDRNREKGGLSASKGWILSVAALSLLVNFPMTFSVLGGSRFCPSVFEAQPETEDKYRAAFSNLTECLDPSSQGKTGRLMYCGESVSNVGYCYLHYFLSPISTVESPYLPGATDLKHLMDENHCTLLWLENGCSEREEYIRIFGIIPEPETLYCYSDGLLTVCNNNNPYND